jgi:hypothetical protein
MTCRGLPVIPAKTAAHLLFLRLLEQPRDSSCAQIQGMGDPPNGSAAPPQNREFRHPPRIMLGTWATSNSSLGFSALKAGDRSLAQSNPHLLRHSRQNSNHRLLKHAGAIEILLGKRPVVDSVAGEPLKVVERFHGPFPAETVKAPEEEAIELTPRCRGEHLLELVTIPVLTGRPVHVPKATLWEP